MQSTHFGAARKRARRKLALRWAMTQDAVGRLAREVEESRRAGAITADEARAALTGTVVAADGLGNGRPQI